MYCNNCGQLLSNNTGSCSYCNVYPPMAPVPPPRKDNNIGWIVFAVVFGTFVMPVLVVFALNSVFLSPVRNPPSFDWTLPALDGEERTTRAWYEPDYTGFAHVVTFLLRDDPEYYRSQRVSIRGVINSMAEYAADEDVYGTRFTNPVEVLWVEDHHGPVVIALVEGARDHMWNHAEISLGSELRFYGRFWDLREINGEQVPFIEVSYWERVRPH